MKIADAGMVTPRAATPLAASLTASDESLLMPRKRRRAKGSKKISEDAPAEYSATDRLVSPIADSATMSSLQSP